MVPSRNHNIRTAAKTVRPKLKRSMLDKTGIFSEKFNKLTLFKILNVTCIPNHIARFKTTPTTAEVIPDKAAAIRVFARNLSIYGAPRKIHKKHGTNVTHRVTREPSKPRITGDRAASDL
tara:strand:+ start:718 stop:1077 length:360 start_codon:yes stop_codon:yes gene_type:complete